MKSEKERKVLLGEAAESALHWARTDLRFFTMRDNIEAYLQASTPDDKTDDWYVLNARKIAMHDVMLECMSRLTRSQIDKLDREVRDIAATLPESAVRHMHR